MSVSRPERVFLASEKGQESEFMALRDDLARQFAKGEEPGPVDFLLADSVAADLWRFRRAGEDGEELSAVVDQVRAHSEGQARRNGLASAEDRAEMREKYVRSIDQAMALRSRLARRRVRRAGSTKLRLVQP
jgi:hypothetical protein